MNELEFWKMSGSGNDFIIIDNRDKRIADDQMGYLVSRICRRRESVGADGLIFVTKSEKYDFAWRFFNADGGEVEMCGNGSRCVARFAYLKGIAQRKMTFETRAGPITAEVKSRMVKVQIPAPSSLKLDIDLKYAHGWISADFINTGVPHVVIQVDNLDNYPVIEQGRMIRYHEMFQPEGTNADFIKMIDQTSIRIRTYERGVEDETLACGTGAIAAALLAASRQMVVSPVRVHTRGGEILLIHFRKDDHQFTDIWLEGKTTIVYKGRLHQEALF